MGLVTDGGNSHNRVKSDNTTSEYYGVCLTSYKKWRASIVFEGTMHNLGDYDDVEEAVKIHDIYAVHFYKTGARLNTKNGEYFITKEEVDDIYKNGIPEKYKRVKRGENRELPQCIKNKGNRWWYEKTYNYETYRKSYASQEEAEEGLRQLIEQKDEAERLRRQEIENNIVRNEHGIAILYSRDTEGEINMELRVDDHVWKKFIHNSWSESYHNGMIYPHGYVDNVVSTLHIHTWTHFRGPIPEGMTVDHVNSEDPTDNRLANLRLANKSLQAHNTIREKKSCLRYKGISIGKGKFSLKYKNKYIDAYHYEEDAIREYNKLAKEEYGDDATLIEVGDTRTTLADYFSDLSLEFLESLNTVQELVQVFIMKPTWGKYAAIKMENFKEYKDLAMKFREGELENGVEDEIKSEDKPDNYTIEYIKKIKTVRGLRDLFRSKEHWRKNHEVYYHHITAASLEKFKNIAIVAKEDDMKQLKINGGFKLVVLRVQRPDIIKLESIEQLANIELPEVAPLAMTPMKALALSNQAARLIVPEISPQNDVQVTLHISSIKQQVSPNKIITLKINPVKCTNLI